MRSIRRTMLLGGAGGTLLILGAAGLIIDLGARRDLLREMDSSLEDKARLLASTLATTTKGLEIDFADFDMEEFDREQEPSHLRLWLADGTLIYESQRSGRCGLAPAATRQEAPATRSLTLSDGQHVRAVQMVFSPRLDLEEDDEVVPAPAGGEPAAMKAAGAERDEEDGRIGLPETPPSGDRCITLVLARDTARIEATLTRLRNFLLIVGLATALAVFAVLRTVLRLGMGPLDRLASEIAVIDAADLSGRIDLPNTPLEIEAIVARLNELMARLAGAFRRERTFSADIAHELRTPLAGLRTSLEVELTRPREAARYQQTLGETLAIVERMQDMVQTLLLLGRLEAGQLHPEIMAVDLAEQTREILASLTAAAGARGLRIQESLPTSLPLLTDPALMETMIRNLLANAVAYADVNGYIKVELEAAAGGSALRITNSGSRVTQSKVPALYERFTRGDAARGGTELHCGLGLALVRRSAATLGLTVQITSEVGGEFTVTLSALKSPEGRA